MKKVAVVYWSGTGNTQSMAESVAAGAKSKGADVTMLTPDVFDAAAINAYDAFAFGCPAMGAEVLEESEFQPMWDTVALKLAGKPTALFGSYGWGDGEWMRSWESSCSENGINLVCESVICNGTPDAAVAAECQALGAALA